MFCSDSATLKPRIRLLKMSMAAYHQYNRYGMFSPWMNTPYANAIITKFICAKSFAPISMTLLDDETNKP